MLYFSDGTQQSLPEISLGFLAPLVGRKFVRYTDYAWLKLGTIIRIDVEGLHPFYIVNDFASPDQNALYPLKCFITEDVPMGFNLELPSDFNETISKVLVISDVYGVNGCDYQKEVITGFVFELESLDVIVTKCDNANFGLYSMASKKGCSLDEIAALFQRVSFPSDSRFVFQKRLINSLEYSI